MNKPLLRAVASALLACLASYPASVTAEERASVAQSAQRVALRVSMVMASNESRYFDPRLKDLRAQLKPLPFKNYRLLGVETRDLSTWAQCGFRIPGGRYLHVTTQERTADHIKMRVLLNEHNRPLLNADVKLDHDSVIVLGGPQEEEGTLIITIRAVSGLMEHAQPAAVHAGGDLLDSVDSAPDEGSE